MFPEKIKLVTSLFLLHQSLQEWGSILCHKLCSQLHYISVMNTDNSCTHTYTHTHIHIRKHTQTQHTHKHNMHNNKDKQIQTYYIHIHTCTHLQINSRYEGRVYNSFGTSSSGMRGTGAVDFSTVYTIVSTLYTTHYSTYRVATINRNESHKRP